MKYKVWHEVVTAWGEHKIVNEHTGSFVGYTLLFLPMYVTETVYVVRGTSFRIIAPGFQIFSYQMAR